MNEMRNETKIVISCVLSAICVIIVAIIVLIGIWTGDNDKSDKEEKNHVVNSLGYYNTIKYEEKEQISKYADDVITYLTTQNMDELHRITNPEYLEYFNLDKDGLKKVLTQKGMLGKVLTTNKYDLAKLGTNRYIRINLVTKNSAFVNDNINIIEYSPNDYKIAFDKFVFYKKEPTNYVREDLQITISNQVAFDNMYKLNVNIKNNTDNAVYINSERAYEFMYLDTSTQGEMRPAVHLYAGQEVAIEKNKSINMNLEFNIDDMTANTINQLIIKDVFISKTGLRTEIKLDL